MPLARRRARVRLPESGAGWQYWPRPAVDGVNDLAAVDPFQADAGDAEIGVSALDDDQRDALAGHLHPWAWRSWCGAKRRRTRQPALGGGAWPERRLLSRVGRLSGRPGRRAARGSASRGGPQAWGGAAPIPTVHSDLAAPAAFPRRMRMPPRAGSRSLSAITSASLIRPDRIFRAGSERAISSYRNRKPRPPALETVCLLAGS